MTKDEYKASPVYTARKTCRLCDRPDLVTILSLGDQYLVNFVHEKNPLMPKAPLEWCRCDGCGLLQLRHTVNPDLLWREYWYRSGVNQTMRDALADVVKSALSFHYEGVWLDIGANDGTLLSKVPNEFKKIACEPALNMAPLVEEHADRVVMDYFAADKIGEPCNVITSCACFYDVDDPNAFVADVAKLLTPDGVWINQLSSTADMLKQNAFDNICHEHVAYYDVPTLQKLYVRHGLTIVGVSHNDVNGGSMRVMAMKKGMQNIAGCPLVKFEHAAAFAQRVRRWKGLMGTILSGDVTMGEPLWLYGASTKASTFLQFLDMNDRFIAAAERNPAKHGLMMAGTWIPITDEAAMRKAAPRYVLVGPWAFRKEFVEREQALRDKGTTMIFPLPNPEFVL